MRLTQRLLMAPVVISMVVLFIGAVNGNGDLALLGGLLSVVTLGLVWLEELRHRRQ